MRHLRLLSVFLAWAISSYACSANKGDDGPEIPGSWDKGAPIEIIVNGNTFPATLADNATAGAFAQHLPLTLEMGDVNSNEKFCYLPQDLPTAVYKPGTIRAGDLMLYGSSGLVLFYKTFSSDHIYTRIGAVDNPTGLQAALGRGTVTVIFREPVVPEPQSHTLTYNTNGADSGSEPASITRQAGTIINLDRGRGFSRSGYAFAGWNTTRTGTGTPHAGGSDYTLNSDITLYAMWQQNNTGNPGNRIRVTIGSQSYYTNLADTQAAKEFKQMLPLTLTMNDYGGQEKVVGLGKNLPTSSHTPEMIYSGDLMLYGSSSLVLFYTTFRNSYSYTSLGALENASNLQSVVGAGSITATFELMDE